MASKTIIVGNICADPEQRFSQAGNAVTTFTVATTEKWKGQDGQMQEETEFHRCVAYSRLAEIIAEYGAKGMKVFCLGRNKTRKWQDQQGNDRWSTEVIVREFEMLSSRRQDSAGSSGHGSPEPPSGGGFPGTGEDVPFIWL